MFRFSVCGKKVMAQVRISQEMMEMEMMDRKFQSQMFMGMDPLDRMSNPWDEEFGGRRGGVRGRRGGMMGRGPGWGGVVRRPDPEYLAYSSPSPGQTGRGRGTRGRQARARVSERLGTSGDSSINPLFDDLYEQPQSTPKGKTGSVNQYQGPQLGGPPKKTWSN